MKIKTIDVNAKEWFDKVNGNSYFSAIATINYGMPDEITISIPFQYGYGDYYLQAACEALVREGYISIEKYEQLWAYCHNNGIILRKDIHRDCRKRDVINYTK